MESIYFRNEEEFNNITKYYSEGFESKLYRYEKEEKELLIKKYYSPDQIKIDKIQKINMLKTENLLKPELLVNIGNTVEGFAMDFIRGLYPISVEKKNMDDIQKYNLIIKLKQILSSLKDEGCLYGDLNVGNILTDGERVYLCDSVNVQIGDYPFDEVSSTMYKYIAKTGTTAGIDIYMLNLLTIYLFNEIEYDSIIETIELAVMNMFNKQSFDNIIGVTDSLDTLNACCDIFLSNQVCNQLIIDYIDINKIECKGKSSKI